MVELFARWFLILFFWTIYPLFFHVIFLHISPGPRLQGLLISKQIRMEGFLVHRWKDEWMQCMETLAGLLAEVSISLGRCVGVWLEITLFLALLFFGTCPIPSLQPRSHGK